MEKYKRADEAKIKDLNLLIEKLTHKHEIDLAAAIALRIHLRLPSCRHGF